MGCVTVKLNEDLPGRNLSEILMFSWCSKCQQMTPSVAMQPDTWCLSFGKYLEMRFHGHAYRRRCLDSNEKDPTATATTCNHSLHRDYVHYFSYNGIVASFSYTPIDVWEISLPSLIVGMETKLIVESTSQVEEMREFSARGYDVYANIYDKLAQLSSDGEFPMLNNLKRSVNNEQLVFREKVGAVQALLAQNSFDFYEMNDAFLVVKRILAENIEMWNQRLNEAAARSRTISANAKQEVTLSALQQQPQTPPVDAGTICTEDLRPESGEITNSDYNDYSRELSSDSDAGKAQLDSPSGSAAASGDRETKSADKKSVITRLRSVYKHSPITLQSPLPSAEHYSMSLGLIPVLVHEHDFSSVIAHSLATHDYKKTLDHLQFCKPNDSATNTDAEEKETSTPKENDKERKTHINTTFTDAGVQFSCRIYFARDFDLLRSKFLRLSGAETSGDDVRSTTTTTNFDRMPSNNSLSANSDEDGDDQQKRDTERIRLAFARSLSKSVQWEARGGKSGSKFCKTMGELTHMLCVAFIR